MYELRQDITTGNWVVLSTRRAERPRQTTLGDAQNLPPFDPDCPFCPGNESHTPPEIFAARLQGPADSPGWQLRIIPNKYPAVIADARLADNGGQAGPHLAGRGHHEVFIDAPEHNLRLGQYDDSRAIALLRAVRDRVRANRARADVAYVAVFKNSGPAAGVSLLHPHGQIVALPITPPDVMVRLDRLAQHRSKTGDCLLCDMAAQELDAGLRVVAWNEDVVVMHPYAAQVPYETWIVPRRHVPVFDALDDEGCAIFALALRDAIVALEAHLEPFDYNLLFVDGTRAADPKGRFHFFLRIFPRQSAIAGFELGAGMYMNTHAPEVTAGQIRHSYDTTEEGKAGGKMKRGALDRT